MKVAFLFDNDGVLIDSSALHWRSWLLFMEEEKRLSMDHIDFIESFGKRNDLILQEMAPQMPESTRKTWAQRKEEIFRKMAQENITLLPGMENFLKEIAEKNYPRIIASSTPVENLKLFLSATILGKYFDQFKSAEEVAHGKPAPDVFLAAADALGFLPQDCIVIEDAPAGIEAGKRAGCFVVALGTTHEQKNLQGYDLFFPTPFDLNLQEILKSFESWHKN
jgi:HAD superfamily hydrolase (TIGR01509 family)